MRTLKDILLMQKKELEIIRNETFVERITNIKDLNNNLIKVIIGPRRVGKSFLALHKLNNFAYVNFDDEDLINFNNYDEIIDLLKELYGGFDYLFLDEIQNLPNWELFVNRLQRQKYNIIISGSNANLLSQELSTHLTGRYSSIIVFPFCFKEFINYFKAKTTAEIKTKFNQYLEQGGYPETFIKEIIYTDYLRLLYDSILFKDIVKRHNLKNSNALEELSRFLMNNFSKLLSYNKIKNSLNFDSVNTVKTYIKYLQECFLFFEVKKFSFKIKEQDNSSKKIYLIDNGFLQAKGFNFSKNIGKLFENLLATHLKFYELQGKIEFFYYQDKNKYEVDFVIKKNKKISSLIQICYGLDNEKTKIREIRALISASENLKCKNLIILTYDYEHIEEFEWYNTKREIKFIPMWKYLLNNQI